MGLGRGDNDDDCHHHYEDEEDANISFDEDYDQDGQDFDVLVGPGGDQWRRHPYPIFMIFFSTAQIFG